MDLWVVGAAAAAGYVAKYLQNFSRDRDSLAESAMFKCEKNEAPICPFPRLTQKKKVAEDNSASERLSDTYHLDGASEADVSTSGYVEKLGSLENCEYNILPLSSLPPGLSTDEKCKENEGRDGLNGHMHDNSDTRCISEMDISHDSRRKRNSLRTKHTYGHFIKPLSSLESCLMAQLYKEHIKMEDYVFSVFPSPSKTMRPLLVTDGKQAINRANSDYSIAWIDTKFVGLYQGESVHGVPPLLKISALDVANSKKSRTRKGHNERFSNFHKAGGGRHFLSQHGSLDQTILFCLGICVGVVSSVLASRREVDKLKDLLKQSENLVQDLQEELEMKDSLTVKEIADENCESLHTCEDSFHHRVRNPLLPAQDVDNSTSDGKESHYEKTEETSEEMSKIEAELEAELERLGLNLNTSNLENKLSNLVELDPDFVADFAQGELRADIVNGRSIVQPESDRDATGTSTTHTANYAVSPRELSLRLHEVIQSRLEERVKKLEMALQNSERKVRLMESEHKDVWRKLSGSELRCSSSEESPIAEDDFSSMAQPLVMNLSGEALDAYNEAYEELMKINESEEDDSPSCGLHENNHLGGICPYNESILCGRSGAESGTLVHLAGNIEKPSREPYFNQLKASMELSPAIQELLYDGASENESSDCNDEVEKQLIKQIVEKTRKGSPVVLNAQRVLFSMDENQH